MWRRTSRRGRACALRSVWRFRKQIDARRITLLHRILVLPQQIGQRPRTRCLSGCDPGDRLVGHARIDELDGAEHVGIERGTLSRVLPLERARRHKKRDDLIGNDLGARDRIFCQDGEGGMEGRNGRRIDLLVGVELTETQMGACRRCRITEELLVHVQRIGEIALGDHDASLRGVDLTHQRDHFRPPPERQPRLFGDDPERLFCCRLRGSVVTEPQRHFRLYPQPCASSPSSAAGADKLALVASGDIDAAFAASTSARRRSVASRAYFSASAKFRRFAASSA